MYTTVKTCFRKFVVGDQVGTPSWMNLVVVED